MADSPGRPEIHHIQLELNGRIRQGSVGPGTTLLETIRDEFDLTGAKPVCEVGTCGACTVLLDDRAVYSCLVLSAECDGQRIDTVEGLADGSDLSVLQQAFGECDALQCGYCTAGQLMSLEGLRRSSERIDSASIQRAVEGNLCRCGAYRHILEAGEKALLGGTA